MSPVSTWDMVSGIYGVDVLEHSMPVSCPKEIHSLKQKATLSLSLKYKTTTTLKVTFHPGSGDLLMRQLLYYCLWALPPKVKFTLPYLTLLQLGLGDHLTGTLGDGERKDLYVAGHRCTEMAEFNTGWTNVKGNVSFTEYLRLRQF